MKEIKLLLSVVLVAGLAACTPESIEPVTVSEDVSIRVTNGQNILDGENAPLIVLDGIIVERDALVNMNPKDIKSISVLKNGSATAIYGSGGKNGVVLITSKK